jgi:AMP-activated protein kinase-like protein
VSDHEIDPFIEEIAGELRRPVRFDSSFESRVMAALEQPVVPLPMKAKESRSWLLRPRAFYVSPLAGLAVAAGLVAIITMSVLRTDPSVEIAADPNAAPDGAALTGQFFPASAAVPVSTPITYIDRTAKSVAVVGSFNDWDATKNVLTRTSDSVWTANIGLIPGRYEYQLVVDGKLIADPSAQQSAKSDFGLANSVLIVSPVPR